MKCKCGSEEYTLELDKRGLPYAKCVACGTSIKKMSTGDVIAYYEAKLAAVDKSTDNAEKAPQIDAQAPRRAMCKYCTEDIYIRQGRLGTIYRKLDDAQFCPMCGRQHQPGDRDY